MVSLESREGILDDLSSKVKIDLHKFITTIYNPNLNEFMTPVSDTGFGPSISEGRLIYGKNKLHLSHNGSFLYQLRDDLFHIGASQPSNFQVDYETFITAIEPLYQFYLKNRGTYLSQQIEKVLREIDSLLKNEHFATRISKNENSFIKESLPITKTSAFEKKNVKVDEEPSLTDSYETDYSYKFTEEKIKDAYVSPKKDSYDYHGIDALKKRKKRWDINAIKQVKHPIAWYPPFFLILLGFDFIPPINARLIFNYIQYPVYAAAIFLGLYPAYWLAKKIDRRNFSSDLSIWVLRLASLGLFGASFLMLFSLSISSIMTIATIGKTGFMFPVFITFFQSLFVGLLFLSGFMMFKFRRKAGIIIFHG